MEILLVEDNPGDVRLVGELLTEAGAEEFDLTHVERLGEAVQRLREDHFDVVLLDLSLPDSNGLDTVVRLQAAAPHVPIVVLTGLDDDLVGLQAVRGGVEDFLIKGEWDANRLARSIRYAIGRRNATQALAHSETLLAIADFASGTAHHLNNLFMVISGRLSLLLESHGSAEIKRSLRIVLEATARGAEIVRRLQAFTRAGPLSEATRVDLNEVVQHTLELTRPRWQDEPSVRGVRIDAVLELGRIPPVLGDSFTLHEVVMNLVFNARRMRLGRGTSAKEPSLRRKASASNPSLATCRRLARGTSFSASFTRSTSPRLSSTSNSSNVFSTMPPSRIRHVKWWSQRIFAFDRLRAFTKTQFKPGDKASKGHTSTADSPEPIRLFIRWQAAPV